MTGSLALSPLLDEDRGRGRMLFLGDDGALLPELVPAASCSNLERKLFTAREASCSTSGVSMV